MKRIPALPLAIGAAIAAWLIDALVTCAAAEDATFIGCLLLDVSGVEWAGRIAILAIFVTIGVLLTEQPEAPEVVDEEPTSDLVTAHIAHDAQILIVGADCEGQITLFNRRCEALTEWSSAEVLGHDLFEGFIPARALPEVIPAFAAVTRRAASVTRELPFLTKRGREVIVNLHISPVHDDAGEIIGAVFVGEEVTESRLSESELLLSRAPWRPLAETVMGDGMAAVDETGRLTWLSASLSAMLGRERQQMVGAALAQLACEEDAEPLQRAIGECLAEQRMVRLDFGAVTADGVRIPAQIALQPLESADDEDAPGAFALVRDLREIKVSEAAMGIAQQQMRAEIDGLHMRLNAAESGVQAAREHALAEQQALVDELRERLAAAEQRAAEIGEAAQAAKEAAVAELRGALAAAEEQVAQAHAAGLAEREAEVASLQEELAGAQGRVEEVKQAAEARLEELRQAAIAERQERLAELTAQLEAAQAEAARARDEALAEQEGIIDDLTARLFETQQAAELAREAARQEFASQLDALRSQAAEAHEVAQAARTAAQAEAREETEALRRQFTGLQEHADRSVAAAEAERRAAEELRGRLAGAEERLAKATRLAGASTQQVEQLRGRLAEAEAAALDAHGASAEDQRRMEELRAELEAARSEAAEARKRAGAEVERAESLARELAERLEQSDRRLAELGATLTSERARAEALASEVTAATAAVGQAREDARGEIAALEEQLAAAFADADTARNEAQSEAAALREELEVAQTQAERLKERAKERLEELAQALETSEAQAQKALREAESCHEQTVEQLRAEEQVRLDGLAVRLAETEAEAERRLTEAAAEHAAALAALTARLTEAEQRVQAVQAEAEALTAAHAGALADREREIEALRGELADARAEVERTREELTVAHEQQMAELHSEMARVAGEAATMAEEAEQARAEYARMLARLSERLIKIERAETAAQEEMVQRHQEKVEELTAQLEDAETRARRARQIASDEYEHQIARSLAEAAAVDQRIAQARDEAREEFREELDRLARELAEADARINEQRQAAVDLRGQKLEELEAQLAEARMGSDEDRLRMAESLEFLRALLDANPYPVFFTDLERRIQACNQAFARRVIGLPRQEITGRRAEDLAGSIPDALVAELQRNERQVRDTGASLGWDAHLKGPDGRTRHWAFQKEPYIQGDEVLGTIGAMIDLTGLERAEAALAQEREQTAAVLRNAPAVIAEIHPDGTVATVYGDCERLLGWTPEELVGSDWWATLFPGDLRDPIRDALGAMRSGGDLSDRVLTVQMKSGEERTLSWSTANARSADRALQSILIVGQDTTDRAREQETLELHFQESIERAKKLRCLSNALRLTQDPNLALVEVLSGIVASLPEAWRYPAITTARGSVYGRERAFGEFPHEPVASLRAPIVVSGEEVGWIEVRYHEERPELSVGPFSSEERDLLDTIAKYCSEMVERRSAEESLSQMRLFRHTLIDQANLWLMATDRERNVVLWNRAAEQISGYTRNEVIGNDRVWEILFPDAGYRAEIIQRLTDVTFGAQPLEDWETVIRAKDGTDLVVSWHAHRLIDDDGRTLGAVALGRQITERRAAASLS